MNSIFGMLELPLAVLLWIVTGLLAMGALLVVGIIVAAIITSLKRRLSSNRRDRIFQGMRR